MVEQKEKKVEEIKKEAEETKRCPISKSLYYIEEFLAGPMCGKCFPCEMGVYEAMVRFRNIKEGKGTQRDIDAIKRIAEDMLESSRCKKGKDTAKFILEWMGTDVFNQHVEGICPDRECIAFMEYRIIPEKCIMCGECKEVCLYNAIIGEKKKPFLSGYLPFEIRQKRCVKCGDCIKVCPTNAIVLVDIKERQGVGV